MFGMALALVLSAMTVEAPAAEAPAAGRELYVLDAQATLPSSDTSWDYMKIEAGTPNLYIARREDGLALFDTDKMQLVHTLENSVGANGPVLLSKYGLGYVAMTDGSLLKIDLKSRQTVGRVKLATDGGLNSGVFEPSTSKLFMIVGGRPKETTWYVLDPASGALLGTKLFPFRKMDDPAYDGTGHLFAPARHDNLILKLHASDLSEAARFQLSECEQPSKVAYHRPADRLLVACRGARPVLQILDPANGRRVASLPIASGVDGLTIDDKRSRIIASGDHAFSVIEHVDDSYRHLGDVATRPGAKIMAMDKATGNIFLVFAGRTERSSNADGNVKTIYHANSFTVLRYTAR